MQLSTLIHPDFRNKATLLLVILLFAAGVFLRVYPSAKFQGLGFDENLYRKYVEKLQHSGLLYYPEIVQAHIEDQRQANVQAKLPPTRFLYIFCGYVWSNVFHVEPLRALKAISCLFTILTLALATLFAWRLGGRNYGLAVLALMSVAPTQLHMAQHAFIDGFFAFWALLTIWLLWENLQRPNRAGWLAAYSGAIAAMVLTKENAFFVFIAVLGLIAAARWLEYGTVTRWLVFATFAGAVGGFALLLSLAGGVKPFVETYHLLVIKAENLQYAIQTGDGPWYRYLFDLLLISPVVLILALGALFTLRKDDGASLFLILFIVFSYVIMANVKNGMNLRYTIIWDMPLRFLAASQLFRIGQSIRRYPQFVPALLIAGLCALELRQYYIFFVRADLYELVTPELLYPINVIKFHIFH